MPKPHERVDTIQLNPRLWAVVVDDKIFEEFDNQAAALMTEDFVLRFLEFMEEIKDD